MPKFVESEAEIRYIARDTSAFLPGTMAPKTIRASPADVEAIWGRLPNEEELALQSFRFPKPAWNLATAEKWFAENKEKFLQKTEVSKAETPMELNLGFLEKGSIAVQSMVFAADQFTESAIKKWLAAKNMDISSLKKNGTRWRFESRPENDFAKGTLRDIVLRDGLNVTYGTLKPELAKSINKKVPGRFSLLADKLFKLSNINVVEVTLTRAPAVGVPAEFCIVKSAENDQLDFHQTVALSKVNDELRHVGGYVMIPDIFDSQGDSAAEEEVAKACWRFMENLSNRVHKGTGTGEEHVKFDGIGHPVESFVDHDGKHGIKGGWFLFTKVTCDNAWEAVKKGEIVGYSIGGRGERTPLNLNVDAPEAISKSDEGIFLRLVNWLEKKISPPAELAKSNNTGIEPKPQTQPQTTKEDKPMSTDLMQKYDLRPSEIAEIEKQGIDFEKAMESFQNFAKAVGINLSTAGEGHTMIRVMQAVNRGEFGQWPNPNDAWPMSGIRKNNTQAPPVQTPPTQTQTPPAQSQTQQQQQQQQVPDDNNEIVKTMQGLIKNSEELTKTNQELKARLEQVEKARGIRKSTDNIPDFTQQQQQDDNWEEDPSWSIDLTKKSAERLLKTAGYDI